MDEGGSEEVDRDVRGGIGSKAGWSKSRDSRQAVIETLNSVRDVAQSLEQSAGGATLGSSEDAGEELPGKDGSAVTGDGSGSAEEAARVGDSVAKDAAVERVSTGEGEVAAAGGESAAKDASRAGDGSLEQENMGKGEVAAEGDGTGEQENVGKGEVAAEGETDESAALEEAEAAGLSGDQDNEFRTVTRPEATENSDVSHETANQADLKSGIHAEFVDENEDVLHSEANGGEREESLQSSAGEEASVEEEKNNAEEKSNAEEETSNSEEEKNNAEDEKTDGDSEVAGEKTNGGEEASTEEEKKNAEDTTDNSDSMESEVEGEKTKGGSDSLGKEGTGEKDENEAAAEDNDDAHVGTSIHSRVSRERSVSDLRRTSLHLESRVRPGSASDGVQSQKKIKKGKRVRYKKRPPKRIDCPLEYDETAMPVDVPDLPSPPPFALSYVTEEPNESSVGSRGQSFAGQQTWREREDSFFLDRGVGEQGKRLHCGFVGPTSVEATGQRDLFHISETDKEFLRKCRVAVVSALFGNFDQVHKPQRSKTSEASRHSVCFVLFLDAVSMQGAHNDSLTVTDGGYIGLWRTIVVDALPYSDNRMNGKIPKMLSHRLLPNAMYSIWVDSKLRLNADPLYILQKFLIQKNAEFAISEHYSRHCVWEEVARNKFLKKFSAKVLDQQLEAYRQDGLKKFDPTDPNRLLPSNIPEGSFFMRAHTPLSNLFSCLWFNEADRFSSRDQVSFAFVYHKLVWSNPSSPHLRINMFRDCDRRAMAKLFHHRAEEKLLLVRKKVTRRKVRQPPLVTDQF